MSYSAINGSLIVIVSSAIYATTLIIMYGASTLYHAITHQKIKALFQKFDHAAIYFLIAGTYTPYTLITLESSLGWIIFSLQWSIASIGIYLKFAFPKRFETLSLIAYVVMGWMIVIDMGALSANLAPVGIYLLVAGGVSYTGGVYFYINDKKPYYHAVWHLFVLAGSLLHFFSVLLYVI